MNINDKTSWFEKELKKLENNNDALAYKFILDFSETVLNILDNKGIKNKNKFLANKLGTSPAYISKLFNGKTNFTVKKLVEISKAVDYELVINLRPKLIAISQSADSTISINTLGKIERLFRDEHNESVNVPANNTFALSSSDTSSRVA